MTTEATTAAPPAARPMGAVEHLEAALIEIRDLLSATDIRMQTCIFTPSLVSTAAIRKILRRHNL